MYDELDEDEMDDGRHLSGFGLESTCFREQLDNV